MFTLMLAYAKMYALRYVARTTVRRGMRLVTKLLGSFWLVVMLLLGYLWLSQHGGLPVWSSSLHLSRSLWVLR